ncbi:MAG: hypothetical protein SPL86_06315 [Succiniclasticum sp.]|nr:hypothetical protein [Succiniclasticum sp.]MDY6291079.1 hypothetical protein [Succiniclasticum sp.]
MTKYRDILRLASLGLSQQSIADSCGASKKTVNRVLKRAKEIDLYWPLDENETDAVIAEKLFPSAPAKISSGKKMPDFDYIQKEFSHRPFQKKEGSRYEIFRNEELPLLAKLPATPYELAEWKSATVQFNYHISVNGMLYSVPYEFIKRKVDVRLTEKVVEIFYNHNRIASHGRLYGRKGQYSTVTEHMPPDHQKFLEWNGDRFRTWAERIDNNTYNVVNAILSSKRVEQQSYRSCMGILKLAENILPGVWKPLVR